MGFNGSFMDIEWNIIVYNLLGAAVDITFVGITMAFWPQ
jgi:hypothetical protein